MPILPAHFKVVNLCCERQDRLLFKNLSFEANAGQLIRIHGKNGSGKSSLLKIITGLLRPISGEIHWNYQNIREQQTHYAKELTYIGHKSAIKPELTIIENLHTLLGRCSQILDKQSITNVLAELDIGDYQSIQAGYLSAGQQRRIALARLWLEPSRLWVLDEPYTALDKDAVKLINALIRASLADGKIVIMTSHQETENLHAQPVHISLGT